MQLIFIGRGHEHHVWNVPQVREIENTVVRGAVLTHHTSPVHDKGDWQVLQTYIVDHLVVGPLQEGAVNGRHRLETLQCQPGREGHCVLLADSHVKKALRIESGELAQAGALGHGSSYGNYLVVFLSQPYHGLSKDFGV